MWKAHEMVGKMRFRTFLYLNFTLTYDVFSGSHYHYRRLPNYFFNNFFELFARNSQRGHPPAAKARVERIFMRAILSCSVLDKKTSLKIQNSQVHLHLPEEGDVNVLTKNNLPYAPFPHLWHAAWLLSTRRTFWSSTSAVRWCFDTEKLDWKDKKR